MEKVKLDSKKDQVFSGKPKKVSWERLWTFSGGPFNLTGWPKKNIHTDPEFAKSCGLPCMAASATQYMGYVAELMIDLFGVQWLSHGTNDLKFIAVVDAGDTLVTKAQIKSKEVQGIAARFTLDVWCENQKGAKVLVGSATGVVGNGNFPPIKPSLDKGDVKSAPLLEPFEYLLSPELNQQYLYAEEDFHAWYIEETEFGSPIGHPGLLLNMSNGPRSPSFRLGPGEAGFHSRDETFFLQPARVGKKMKVIWKWIGTYEKRDRPYRLSASVVVDEDGVEIMKRFVHATVASKQYQK
jgi:hypothetical protein